MKIEQKARMYIFGGNFITVVLLIFLSYFVWDQQLKPLWLQNQAKKQFASQLSQATNSTPTPQPAQTATPTNTPTPQAIPVEPVIIATEIPKGSYLLEIPNIQLSWMVHHISPTEIDETDPWGIKKSLLDEYGVVDYPYLQYPGEKGMVSIAGHANISGNPFWYLSWLGVNDKITITTQDGTVTNYTVYQKVIVDPDDPIFWETKYTHELRLVSCLTNSTKKRVIIFAYQTN